MGSVDILKNGRAFPGSHVCQLSLCLAYICFYDIIALLPLWIQNGRAVKPQSTGVPEIDALGTVRTLQRK